MGKEHVQLNIQYWILRVFFYDKWKKSNSPETNVQLSTVRGIGDDCRVVVLQAGRHCNIWRWWLCMNRPVQVSHSAQVESENRSYHMIYCTPPILLSPSWYTQYRFKKCPQTPILTPITHCVFKYNCMILVWKLPHGESNLLTLVLSTPSGCKLDWWHGVWVCWRRVCGVPFCHPTSSGIQNVCTVSLQARQIDKTPQYKLLSSTVDPSFNHSSCLSGLCPVQRWTENYIIWSIFLNLNWIWGEVPNRIQNCKSNLNLRK